MTSTIFTTFQTKQSLPVSQTTADEGPKASIRRRLSSLSLKIQPTDSSPSPPFSWAFPRSKSMSSMGEYAGSSIKKWWASSWDWILSRKPAFAIDLEMNEQEAAVLGCQNKGSWGHVFYKLKSEVSRLLASRTAKTLPR